LHDSTDPFPWYFKFFGENGMQFQAACRKFLEDEKYVANYLNERLKNTNNEKFTEFLAVC
jgi:hypothetical protein